MEEMQRQAKAWYLLHPLQRTKTSQDNTGQDKTIQDNIIHNYKMTSSPGRMKMMLYKGIRM